MPKRVLYIEGNTDGTVGGSYFVLLDLVNRLDRSLYEPIVGFHRENYLIDRFTADSVEVVLFTNPSPLNFRREWMNWLLAPVKKAINLYRGLIVAGLSHARYLRESKIDLINLNNSITRNYAWMFAALITRTKCITHEMGINVAYPALSRFFGKRLDRIICVSHAIRGGMKKCGIDYPNITVIHCGIDLTRYRLQESPAALRAKHAIPDGAPVIGLVGNIRRWKGQETLVRATALLTPTYPNLRCVLVGDCGFADKDYGDHIARLCRELDIVENVIFAGFRRNAIDYMELMDVVTHTSIHPEPFGIVTLEAMSRAKPLVSTTIGGPAEVVVNGESGLLVDPGKPELLAGAIHTFLSDMERAKEVGKKGYERMTTHFSMKQNIDRTLAVYAQVLGSAERAPEERIGDSQQAPQRINGI